MNLIISYWLVLNIQIVLGAYKKKDNEHCSLQVNSMCYDDELNDKPLKIVHDENGMQTIVGSTSKNKKNHKKLSTDVIQPKISWDRHLPKFRLFGYSKFVQQYRQNLNQQNQPNSKPKDTFINQTPQIDQTNLIVKYHKLDDSIKNNQLVFTNIPKSITRSISDTSTILPNSLNQVQPTLSSPTIISTLNPILNSMINPLKNQRPSRYSTLSKTAHLRQFKTINRPLLASSTFNKQFLNKFRYPLISPYANSLTIKLPDNYVDSPLLTDKSTENAKNKLYTKIKSNYLPKSLSNTKIPKNLSFNSGPKTSSTTAFSLPNHWLPNDLTTTNDLLMPPLPTNLTNYINLRESGRLNELNNENNYNTTQDRMWTDDDHNDLFPTKSSNLFEDTSNKTKNDPFQFASSNSLESGNEDDLTSKVNTIRSVFDLLEDEKSKDTLSTTTDLTKNNEYLFSTEENSKEMHTPFKLDNQLELNDFKNMDHSNEFMDTVKGYNQEQNDLDNSKEFAIENFASAQPLNNQHEWAATIDNTHYIDDLLNNDKQKLHQDDKSTINYLTEDEQKENLLMNHPFLNDQHDNYPIFYPDKNQINKPTYTIIQLKDNNFDKWKKYAKLIKKVAIEEAKKFKRNELDTFLKRKKLIIERYKPNDLVQKAISAKYVWKKVSLDFLSLLGYQIANYLGPLNSKHWIKHADLIDPKDPEQLKAIEHILKNQHLYSNGPNQLNNNKYILNNGQLLDHTFSDDFNAEHAADHIANHITNDLSTQITGDQQPLSTHATVNQFLNDDKFFHQNYFKFKENSLNNDQSFQSDQHKLVKEQDKVTVNEEPLMSSSLLNDQSTKNLPLNKEKELDKQFFNNQLLNNKLLSQQLLKDKLIDFRTKEQLLEQVIKPIKIVPQIN